MVIEMDRRAPVADPTVESNPLDGTHLSITPGQRPVATAIEHSVKNMTDKQLGDDALEIAPGSAPKVAALEASVSKVTHCVRNVVNGDPDFAPAGAIEDHFQFASAGELRSFAKSLDKSGVLTDQQKQDLAPLLTPGILTTDEQRDLAAKLAPIVDANLDSNPALAVRYARFLKNHRDDIQIEGDLDPAAFDEVDEAVDEYDDSRADLEDEVSSALLSMVQDLVPDTADRSAGVSASSDTTPSMDEAQALMARLWESKKMEEWIDAAKREFEAIAVAMQEYSHQRQIAEAAEKSAHEEQERRDKEIHRIQQAIETFVALHPELGLGATGVNLTQADYVNLTQKEVLLREETYRAANNEFNHRNDNMRLGEASPAGSQLWKQKRTAA